MEELNHIDSRGRALMVEVGHKEETVRVAIASASLMMNTDTLNSIINMKVPKGDVIASARIASILAAKKCSNLIPMCHPLRITSVEVLFRPDILERESSFLRILSRVKAFDRTGVEMEALTAVSVAGLTVYDMCKSLDKEMVLGEICLIKKSGGKSGDYLRSAENIESYNL
ncbi:MAG: cyclic pyranopterin monophosphate synthase MoaC [Nitrospinae bacterium]|nr:cyclic pyranopterin monophosphate synthase MoaC [Nitrospinota bacterium]